MSVATTSMRPAPRRATSQAGAARKTLRVVAIGGGTGLSTLLRGLREHVASPHAPAEPHAPHLISDLAAVVTVTDDGGSSGRLRRHFNMLPPGDLRNCMVALADDEALLSRLFRHRFSTGEGLEGHSFGNLFVAALAEITGDFAQAVKLSSQVLATRGHIYPVTTANVTLVARMDDGSLVRGETNITASKRRICELMLAPSGEEAAATGNDGAKPPRTESPGPASPQDAPPGAEPLPETLDSIARADLITVGPGSLYTSVITNLLVTGMAEAMGAARAVRVFVCNLMTQANESLGLSASQHIERIYEHARQPIFDYALVNTAPVSEALRERYAREGAEPIEADCSRIEALGVRCIAGDFAAEGDVLRHNAGRVTETLLRLGLEA